MKFLVIRFTFLLFSYALLAQPETSGLKISHLVGDFYVYTTYKDLNGSLFPSNSMYVVTDDGVVLFDTPWDENQFQPLLDSIQSRHSKKVTLAISTHYHDDRTAGLDFFKKRGIRTYSSEMTASLGKSHNEKVAEYTFKNDTIFKVGGYEFETFYPGPGHTRDNIVIWSKRGKVLFGGCLIKSSESKGLGNIADADLANWGPTLSRVKKKYPKAKFVIPGHFGWSGKKSLRHTQRLVKQHLNKENR